MYIVLVHVHVRTDQVNAFTAATKENAENSVGTEPGVARFDFMQQADDPTRFILIEVYGTPEDAAKHKVTGHYAHWRDIVEPMMIEPRSRVTYRNIHPSDIGYSKSPGD
jgi:autoinducer 2-degrading protein